MSRRQIVALLAAVALTRAVPGKGQDFVAVRATAVAESEPKAVHEAYYAALERALTGVAWYQAAGDVGARFRRDFEQDFETFKSRYFTPDTDHRCALQDSGRHLCEVEGTLKFTALQADLRRLIKGLERATQQHLTFALSAAEAKDRRKQFVVDELSGAFAGWGHRILMDSAANSAIARHQVDYALGIYEVTFTNLDDPSAYDPYSLQLAGTLTVRFKLSHLKSGEVVAIVPVAVSANEPGANAEMLKPKLVASLGKRAADEIARKVNAAVVSHEIEERAGNTTW